MATKIVDKGPIITFRNSKSNQALKLIEKYPRAGYNNAYKATINGYTHFVELSKGNFDCEKWCHKNDIAVMSISPSQFFFKSDEDAVMFKLVMG